MNPTSKKTTLLGIAVLVVLVLFFVVSVQRGSLPDDGFKPPVYESGVPDGVLARPLFLDADTASTAVSAIAEFKRAVLARVASTNPLSDAEKSVLRASISTVDASRAGTLMLANQTLLRFSPDELASIEAALAL